jgi:hypothetical protein
VTRPEGDGSGLDTTVVRVSLVTRSGLGARRGCRLVVDGKVVGTIRYRQPLTLQLVRGEHELTVKRWAYKAKPMKVTVKDATPMVLYAGQRPMPAQQLSIPTTIRWIRDCTLWISDQESVPPCKHGVGRRLDRSDEKTSLPVPAVPSPLRLRPGLRLLLSTFGFIGLTSIAIVQGRSLWNPIGFAWIALGVLGTVAGVVQVRRARQ